jgi:short-subunit dehydrogenase
LAARGGYADVLVNSAGIGLAGRFGEQSADALTQLVDLNVRALTALTRHFLTGMRVRGRGGILNLASLGGYAPGPNQAAYYASKAYVLSLSEAVAAETAGEGVRVCALAPGPVDTRFHARMGAEGALYRTLLPPASAEAVARAGYLGFALGWRVTIPGLINPFLALAMRVMPHRLVIPIVGWLLQPRGQNLTNA